MWTIALSGPERTRAKAEVALEQARIPILPSDHHALMDWPAKFPDEKDVWLTVEHSDVDAVVRAVDGAKGWRLRVHFETPPEPEQTELQTILHDIGRRLAALEGRAV